jgi:hypothetical protein
LKIGKVSKVVKNSKANDPEALATVKHPSLTLPDRLVKALNRKRGARTSSIPETESH